LRSKYAAHGWLDPVARRVSSAQCEAVGCFTIGRPPVGAHSHLPTDPVEVPCPCRRPDTAGTGGLLPTTLRSPVHGKSASTARKPTRFCCLRPR
jgi:hypothetical protein